MCVSVCLSVCSVVCLIPPPTRVNKDTERRRRMYADERETKTIDHEFLMNVHVWYSEKAKKKDGHGVYVTPMGRFIEGTTHTDEKKNPYLDDCACDGEYVGVATTLKTLVDVPKWLPLPEMAEPRPTSRRTKSLCSSPSCNFVALSNLLLQGLLSFSGMAHED